MGNGRHLIPFDWEKTLEMWEFVRTWRIDEGRGADFWGFGFGRLECYFFAFFDTFPFLVLGKSLTKR